MGATNTTTNYSLSQFISTDKPAWLQDYNGDMLKIDTGINAAKVAADNAGNAASAAQGDATSALGSITSINTTLGTLSGTVNTAVGNINTINSLIGNGTPTTTDQTIIGAINEINGKVSGTTSIIAVDDYVEVVADGVKTLDNLLNEAGISILTVAAGLSNDEVIELTSVKGNAIGTYKSVINGVFITNATTTFVARSLSVAISTTVIDNEIANISETASACTSKRVRSTIADGTMAYTDLGAVVPASGYIVQLHYKKYKNIL